MWLVIPLLILALLVVGFGIAVGAVIALTVKLFPILVILLGVWLLVRAFGGSRRSRQQFDDRREFRDRWQRHGPWHGWEHAPAGYGWNQAPPTGRDTHPPRPHHPVRPSEPTPKPSGTTVPVKPPPGRELPIDVQVKVEQIRRKADMLLEYADRFPPFSQDLHIVRQTAADYLPRTVEAYLKVPGDQEPVIRATGKTALEELKEQLQLLDAKLDEIAEALQRQDLDRMMANRRFLEERFKLNDESRAAESVDATGEIEAA
jgi:hypothetical protein